MSVPPVAGHPSWLDPVEDDDPALEADPAGAWCDRCQMAVWPHDTCVGCGDDETA